MEIDTINNDMVDELLDRFYQRSILYRADTIEILNMIKPTLEGIIIYLDVDPLTVQWESIDLIDKLVVLVVRIIPPETNTTTKTPHRVITVGIPLDFAASSTKEEVVDFLTRAETAKKASLFSEFDDELPDDIETVEDLQNMLDSLHHENDSILNKDNRRAVEEAMKERKSKKVLH